MSRSIPQSFLRELSLDRDAVHSFDRYPYSVPAVRHLTSLEFHPNVTYLIGENGMGKSTLVESIAVQLGLNPEGGTRHLQFETRASHADLYKNLRLARGAVSLNDAFFLRAESFFNLATEVDRLGVNKYYGGRSLHEQSHGESFFSLFLNRFGGGGLYILDEPEAALSPMRQIALVGVMHELIGRRSQFVVATHSPIVMSYPEATIYEFTAEGIREQDYESTEHYRITRGFLENRERTLRELFGEDTNSRD